MIDLKNKKQAETSAIPMYRAKFYASIFGNIDRAKDRIFAGAFSKAVEKGTIQFVYGHDGNRPISTDAKISEDEKGLLVEVEIPYINDGKKAVDDWINGVSETFSFGYSYVDIEYNRLDDCFDCKEFELYEVSTASVPCNPEAKLISIEKINQPN